MRPPRDPDLSSTANADPAAPLAVGTEETADITEPEPAPPIRATTPAEPPPALLTAPAGVAAPAPAPAPPPRTGFRTPRPTLASPIPALLAASMRQVGVDGGNAVPRPIASGMGELTSRQGEAERQALLGADADYVVEVIDSVSAPAPAPAPSPPPPGGLSHRKR